MAYTFKHGDRPLEGVTIQRAVGRGGFGEVYYAVTDAGRQIALKYLRDNPDVELRGVGHVMNLKSPHLVTIFDVRHNEDGEPFVIMEYVSGPSLRDIINAEPKGMSPEKAVFFINGIAKGLSYLHERGVVHRDLKPGNIFYDDGYVVIGDYGLSKHISVSRHSNNTVSVGTVHYMAPEIGSGRYTKAIDIYSLGVILYEMLTGALPFTGSSMGEILMRHLNDDPDTSLLPPGFGPVVARALAKKPEDRYQNVDEMVDELARLTDVGDRLSQFDPTTLRSVPRAAPQDDTPTRTARRRPPAMDVGDIKGAAQTAGEFGERMGDWGAKFGEHMGQWGADFGERMAKWGGGFGERMAGTMRREIRRKVGERVGQRHQAARRAPKHAHGAPSRGAQWLVILLVALGAALGVEFVTQAPGLAPGGVSVITLLFLLGSLFGVLLAYFKLLHYVPKRSAVYDRILYAAAAIPFMLPAFALIAGHRPAVCLGVAIVGTLLICNWTKRVEAGRRGMTKFDLAVAPAISGGVLAGVLDAEGFVLAAVILCALLALLTQAAAAMWPFVGGAPMGRRAPRPDGPDDLYAGAEAVAPSFDARPNHGGAAAAVQTPPQAAPAVQPRRRARWLWVIGAALIAIVGIALAGHLLTEDVQTHDARVPPPIKQRDALVTPQVVTHSRVSRIGGLPKLIFVGQAVIAGVAIVSRRRTNAAHILRAGVAGALFVSSGLLITAVVSDMHSLSTANGIQDPSVYGPLGAGAALLIGAIVLYAWPAGERENQRIVI